MAETKQSMKGLPMTTDEFNELAGRDDALYRALGVLAGQLHVSGALDIRSLLLETDRLAEAMPVGDAQSAASRENLRQIVCSYREHLPVWDEDKTVAELYRTQPMLLDAPSSERGGNRL